MSWELKNFEELGFIGRGKSRHRPRNDERLYNGIYPLIQTSEIQASNLYINNFTKTYNEFGLAQSKLWKEGTLCLSIVGANTAETAILGFDACFPDSVIGFNAFENVSDNLFVKYFFDFIKIELKSISEGTARENLSMEKLLSKKREVPNYNTQKRIANILSTYDNLIENNLKRIKLLEETAQNIYKEWFVNFRFPNYEHTEFDKVSGLPKGWEKRQISTLMSFLGGFAFKSLDYKDSGKYRVVTIKNVGDRIFDNSNTDGIESIPDKLKEYCKIKEGQILMSLTGNVGRTCLTFGENLLLNQRVVIINPHDDIHKPFIYWMFNTDDLKYTMNNLSNGAAQQNLSPIKLSEQYVVIPNQLLLKKYYQITNDAMTQIISLNKQNQMLKEARDILLPRLMNRTIEV